MSEDENRALFASAVAHHQAGRSQDAIRDYRAVLARNPRIAPAHNNLGLLLDAAGSFEEAEQCFREALALRPVYPEALNNLGAALRVLRKSDEALACFQQSLEFDPNNADALINLGDLLRELGRYEEAVGPYTRAQELRPDDHRIYRGMGHLLVQQDQTEEAIAAFKTAALLKPDAPDVRYALLTALQTVCEWQTAADEERVVLEHVRAGRAGVGPFLLLSTAATPADQRACADTYAPAVEAKPPLNLKKPGDKIRIGYLSGDYRDHPVPFLVVGMIEQHDRARFDVVGYSVGENDNGTMRRRLERAFDRFEDLAKVSDRDVARRIAADDVDILVDLSGYTRFARPGIPAFRPAPVQVNYLGYPGTMGGAFMDYIIADREIIPHDQQRFYAEKVVYLPECYQPNDHMRPIAATALSRTACGLPEKAFVFCSFNRPSKITPALFTIWMDLLRAVPGSVLWLLEFNSGVSTNLRREAQARGVDPARLVFAPFVPSPENLARLRNADLFLDTLPYNAHTTMSDALWSGLPAITCRGDTFAARVGASLLQASGLAELITDNLNDYADLALALARDPDRLDEMFAKLENPERLPLFDTARYTRNIEKAYVRMAELQRAGRAPESFSV